MHPSTRSKLAVQAGALALLAMGVSGAVGAQEPGSVSGVIYDSVSARPLAGAEVFVWNTSIRAITGADGAFTLESVPPGRQRLVFVHDILLQLGVSTGSGVVEVRSGEDSAVEMATPSPFTIARSSCLLDGADPVLGMVAGFVEDDVSDVPLPGARIHVTWLDELQSPHTLEAVSDARGWFRFCDVPTDTGLGVTARFLNRTAARRELALPPSGEEWLHFQVADLEEGSLSGTLRDQDRGWGIEDAEVSLVGTQRRTVSGPGGRFRLPSVPPGEYTLLVEHLAYGERRDDVSVGSSMAVSVVVNMSVEPIALDPIEVEVESIVDMDGIVAGGTLVTREDIDAVRHRARDLADLLRMQHMKDVIVQRGQTGELCVGITTGQVRMFKKQCTSAIFYVDNARVTNPEMVVQMSAQDIDRIVVYRPVEAGNLFGYGAGNGVIAVYTRSGRRP